MSQVVAASTRKPGRSAWARGAYIYVRSSTAFLISAADIDGGGNRSGLFIRYPIAALQYRLHSPLSTQRSLTAVSKAYSKSSCRLASGENVLDTRQVCTALLL